jgi:hypothetical protein
VVCFGGAVLGFEFVVEALDVFFDAVDELCLVFLDCTADLRKRMF